MINYIENYNLNSLDDLNFLKDNILSIIYPRVSTYDQADRKWSLNSQIEEGIKLAENKLKHIEENILVIPEPGESGDDPDRPAMNNALWCLENGIGRTIIMLHPSRLSRDSYLQSKIADRVWSAGCTIEFCEMDFNPDNAESMLMFNVQGAISQYNKAKILADSKRGRRNKVKNGQIPGMRRLYGYSFEKEFDVLIPNEEEKSTYLLMVDWILNGKDGTSMSCSSIARELAKADTPAPSGDIWYQATVSRILKNFSYTGKYHYGKTETLRRRGKSSIIKKPEKEWVSIPIPSFITKETYDQIQDKLLGLQKKHTGRPTSNYLLKGLLECGKCGKSYISGSATKNKNSTTRYYACSKKNKRNYKVGSGERDNCSAKNHRVEYVDKYVWEYLCDVIKHPEDILEKIIKQKSDPAHLDGLIKKRKQLIILIEEKERILQKKKQMFETGIIENIEDLIKEVNPIKKEIIVIKKDLEIIEKSIEQVKKVFDDFERVQKNIKALQNRIKSKGKDISFEDKREFVTKLIIKVILFDNNDIHIKTIWSTYEESNQDNTHSKSIPGQDDSLVYYVDYHEILPPVIKNKKLSYKVLAISEHLDKVKEMYYEKGLSFANIGQVVGCSWWSIRSLLIYYDLPILPKARKRNTPYLIGE